MKTFYKKNISRPAGKLAAVLILLSGVFTVSAQDKVTIRGSNTIGEELAPRLITEYKKGHGDTTFDLEFKGSSYGIGALMGGFCDIAGSSKPVSKEQREIAQIRSFEFKEYDLGSYSVSVFVNATNQESNLTSNQVAALFTGKVQNWKEVGGPDSPVHPYARDPVSGTHLGFKELAMGFQDYGTNVQYFTNYTQIAEAVAGLGTPVSPPVVRDWLDDQGLALHKIAKVLAGGQSPDRNAQFLRIAELRAEYAEAGNPVFSMDSKAKEHLGQLFRAGRVYTQQAFKAFDHDFPSWATGNLILHGIYDIARNRGHVNIGLSHDTSEFACDSFRWYWNRIGKQCYTDPTSILLLSDGGGSNSASQYLFKQYLQDLVNDLGIEIRIAHYPSYCSKFNPIERRFFPHITRACKGMLFDTLETAVGLIRKASTTTGLATTVNVIRGLYETGKKVADDFKSSMTLLFDTLIPKWNYVAIPQ